jgi:hypothetical protein
MISLSIHTDFPGDYLENLRKYVINSRLKRLTLIWDHQKDWLTILYLPMKALYLNPNEGKCHV